MRVLRTSDRTCFLSTVSVILRSGIAESGNTFLDHAYRFPKKQKITPLYNVKN